MTAKKKTVIGYVLASLAIIADVDGDIGDVEHREVDKLELEHVHNIAEENTVDAGAERTGEKQHLAPHRKARVEHALDQQHGDHNDESSSSVYRHPVIPFSSFNSSIVTPVPHIPNGAWYPNTKISSG